LKVLHPFTPFVAEELWHALRERAEGDDIIISAWPSVTSFDAQNLKQFDLASEVITNIRNIRKSNNIATKVKLELFIRKTQTIETGFDSIIVKMGNLSVLEYVEDKVANANSFIVAGNEYFIPFGDTIDVEAEKAKISEELTYTKGFLKSVQSKLSNARFVAGAPEAVITNERNKEADALAKIALLEEKMASLN
jgi:valyl-tRNA synthetase